MSNYVKLEVVFKSNFGPLDNLAKKELVRGHNYMANKVCTEKFYKRYNKVFEKLCPDKDTNTEEGFAVYNAFINGVAQRAIDSEMNDKHFSYLLRYEIGNEHQLIGVNKLDDSMRIEFFLREAK